MISCMSNVPDTNYFIAFTVDKALVIFKKLLVNINIMLVVDPY